MPDRISIIGPPGARVLVPVGKGGIRQSIDNSLTFLVDDDGTPFIYDEGSDTGGILID